MKSSFPALIVALCIGLYFLYMRPTISEIKGLSVKKAEYENVLLRVNELAIKRDEILAQYNNIPQEQIEKLNKIIPNSYDSVKFANDINNLTSTYGLAIRNIKDNSVRASDRSNVVSDGTTQLFRTNMVQITVYGDYDDFVGFLNDLESNLRLIDVKKLTLKSMRDERLGTSKYEFVLEVAIYSLK